MKIIKKKKQSLTNRFLRVSFVYLSWDWTNDRIDRYDIDPPYIFRNSLSIRECLWPDNRWTLFCWPVILSKIDRSIGSRVLPSPIKALSDVHLSVFGLYSQF
jgi:hypothetical protein